MTGDDAVVSIYDAAMEYVASGTQLVVIGGREYGTGSSRDWAAKGTRLLGVRAVIVESFERIHRSNLIGMGVLPLCFKDGKNRVSLGLSGDEKWDILGLAEMQAGADISARITYPDGSVAEITLASQIYTDSELEFFHAGGILHNVLKNL